MSKPEPTAEEYYGPILKDHKSINNKNAIAIYFEETEPPAGRPTHFRVLHTAAAETIAKVMFAGLLRDIHSNSRWAWRKGRPLPNPEKLMPGAKTPLQPLAEGGVQLTV